MNVNRILDKVFVAPNSCWLWEGSCTSAGYGQLMEDKNYWSAHRYSYTAFKGDIQEGLVVRHLCHNTLCCNPDHLMLGTNQENWKDSEEKHRESYRKIAKEWVIGNNVYTGIRSASKETGVHQATILKYTENGIFNVERYKRGCSIANVVPKKL